MSNPFLLKKAMKALDLSGAALARRLSQYRDDGRITATETVSRWASGANNVDPAVLAWLEELLRSKALQSLNSLVEWPQGKRSLTIGITSPKGGVGTTTIAINLAVVAQKDFGITTHHVTVSGNSAATYAATILKPLQMNTYAFSYKEILSNVPNDKEVMIVDIPSTAVHSALEDYPDSFLARFEPNLDILLIPADFGSRFDILNYSRLLEIESPKPKIRFIHRPRIFNIDFFQTAAKEGLDVTSENFYPYLMPQARTTSPHIPPGLFEEWANKEQQGLHQDLFEYIMNSIGGEIHYSNDVMSRVKSMTLIELLDYLERE